MEKVLNQEEIDAMVRLARSGGSLPIHEPPKIEPWDARRSGRIGREQLQALTVLHEGFARNLTHSLGAYLRVVFVATLVSAENLAYREFSQTLPEATYIASCRLEPMGESGILQLDLKVAFPIIDLLLGGQGKSPTATREITEIEQQILESVAHVVCRELGMAWQAISLHVSFAKHLEAAEVQRLIPPDEKVLSLSFEINMPGVQGALNLAVPATVSNALLRDFAARLSYRRPRGRADSRQRIMRRLLDCRFEVELGARDVRSPIADLAGLTPGTLLSFPRSARKPASLLVAGREMFQALPVRCGNIRAAKILEKSAAFVEDTDDIKEHTQK
jgi:flagellar motor switch protein FliM